MVWLASVVVFARHHPVLCLVAEISLRSPAFLPRARIWCPSLYIGELSVSMALIPPPFFQPSAVICMYPTCLFFGGSIFESHHSFFLHLMIGTTDY